MYALHSRLTPHTWHLTLHTLHFHSPHSELYTWHSTLLHFTLRTPHSALYTSFHSTLYTWHPTPPTPHSALYTSHCTLFAPHSTLYNPHSTLYTFTLYTLHFTFHPHNLTLVTLVPEWNAGLASFSCCARTPTSRPQLRLSTVYFFPRCQRSTPMPKVDLSIFPITSHHAGFAVFPYPLRATLHQSHMFSSSSPSTYIAPIRRFGMVWMLISPTCRSFRPARPLWRKNWTTALRPLCFHAKLPAKLAFVPCPWASSFALLAAVVVVLGGGGWPVVGRWLLWLVFSWCLLVSSAMVWW